jgi:histidinol-phosphatase
VAAGVLDAVVLFGGSQWDHAAVVAILEAAGGRYTDLQGDARIDTDGGIYTNGVLHDALVATVAL